MHSHTRRALEAGCTPDELGHSCSSFEGADKVDQLTCLEPGFSHVLREELDPRWAARPIAMARHRDRTVLVLQDPGGVPLDRLLGQPLNVAFSLRLTVS